MSYDLSSIMSLISHIHTVSADFTSKRLPNENNFVSSHGYILYLLSQKNKMTMSDVAKSINRTKSTTTVLIKKLKDLDLIKEEASTEDSRQKLVSLTEKGAEYNEITSSISKELMEVCYKNFTEEEKETLLHLLKKLNDNIEND